MDSATHRGQANGGQDDLRPVLASACMDDPYRYLLRGRASASSAYDLARKDSMGPVIAAPR